MSLGRQLKLARVQRDLKAKDLAAQVGVTPKYLSQIENERAPGLSVEIFARLCRALDTTPNDVMEWESTP